MSILSALKTQTNSIDDLAALPQALIMQMAQKGQIREDMLAPILSRKAEMAEAVARTKALQGQGQQPTVMEQIMQKNAEAESPAPEAREMGVAQLPVRPGMYQGMAGGGIVAFYDGGDVEDDDENEAYQEALEDAEMEDMMDKAILSKGVGLGGLKVPKKESSEFGISAEKKEPPGTLKELQAYVLNKESGGRRYDKEGKLLTSSKGAEGEMQVMPMTQRDPGFGVSPAKDNSPEEKARVGRDYLAALYNRYQDPKIAAIAYNWGPGNTDKWLSSGADVKKLPKETRNYIAQLAEGGEVKHFYSGDYVSFGEEAPYDPNEPSLYSRFGDIFGSPVERLGSSIKGFGFTTERERKENIAKREKDTNLKQAQEREPSRYDQTTEAEDASFAAPVQTAQQVPPSPPETAKDAYTRALERFEARQAKLAASEGEDKNLALMAAGLGMMGGTSPYALANIGAGGMKGLEQYAASKRSRTAEELANEKALAGLLKTKEYAEIRGANAKALEESRLRDDLLAARKQVEANVMSRYKGDPALWDPKTKAKVTQEIQQALAADEYYNLIAKKLGVSSGPSAPTPIGSYSLKSGLNVNK